MLISPAKWIARIGLAAMFALAVAACNPAADTGTGPGGTGATGATRPASQPATAAANPTAAAAPATTQAAPAPAAGTTPTPTPYAPEPAAPSSAEPFRIGAMHALTGIAESYGNPILQAMQLAVTEINAGGGVSGRMLELIPEDSKCSAQDAITAYNKLTAVDGVKIILGATCSGAMLGAAPLAEADGVVLLSPSATSPDIAAAGDYIFRTAINDAQLGVDTANTLWHDGIRAIATINETTDYAEGARRTTVAQFESLGGRVLAAESYASEVTDFRSQLTKLAAASPEAIYLASQGEFAGGTIVKQARELGYNGPIYSEVVPTNPEALGIAGAAATGLKAIVPNPELSTGEGIAFLEKFEARYGSVATLPWFQASAYDGVYIAAQCLAQTGDDQDAAGFRNCLYDTIHTGAIGVNYGFDANGDVVGLNNVVVEVLPVAERTDANLGYYVIGPAPMGVTAGANVPVVVTDHFRIGIMDALTGVAESYGNPILQAKQLAVEEINAAGGINGKPLAIIPEDSKCTAQDAITAYNKLTAVDGVKIILGTSCSGAMLGAAPLAEADGVILFSASATSPDIATAGDYIFRTAINDAQLGVDTGNAMWADGIRSIATVTESTDYAEGARRTTVARFETLGGETLAGESYSSDVTDFRSQLTKLIAAGPDAIHLAAQGEFSGGTIVKQLRELGYDGPIYTEVVPTGPEALGIAGEAATGMKAIVPNPELSTDKGMAFLKNFEARYGTVPTIPWFQASGYDDVYIAAACLKQTGSDQDAAGFRDCLYNLTFSGAIGDNYRFDANGDIAGLGNVIVQVLPLAERNEDNLGYRVLGPAPAAP